MGGRGGGAFWASSHLWDFKYPLKFKVSSSKRLTRVQMPHTQESINNKKVKTKKNKKTQHTHAAGGNRSRRDHMGKRVKLIREITKVATTEIERTHTHTHTENFHNRSDNFWPPLDVRFLSQKSFSFKPTAARGWNNHIFQLHDDYCNFSLQQFCPNCRNFVWSTTKESHCLRRKREKGFLRFCFFFLLHYQPRL